MFAVAIVAVLVAMVLAVARALSMDPRIIFYDEPTTGLDPTSAAEIQEIGRIMRAMLKEEGPPPEGRWADLALLEPVRQRGGTVLELGCGTGEVARALSERGARVIGIDRPGVALGARLVRSLRRRRYARGLGL